MHVHNHYDMIASSWFIGDIAHQLNSPQHFNFVVIAARRPINCQYTLQFALIHIISHSLAV